MLNTRKARSSDLAGPPAAGRLHSAAGIAAAFLFSAGGMDEIAPLTLQVATPLDARAVTELLTISYTRLLAADYDVGQMRAMLPSVTVANRAMLGSGRYYLVRSGAVTVGCGGWSQRGDRSARLHYFATHPNWLRMGVGTMVMRACLAAAKRDGAKVCDCAATVGAVPFYRSFGFAVAARAEIRMRRGLAFPVIEMRLDLQK